MRDGKTYEVQWIALGCATLSAQRCGSTSYTDLPTLLLIYEDITKISFFASTATILYWRIVAHSGIDFLVQVPPRSSKRSFLWKKIMSSVDSPGMRHAFCTSYWKHVGDAFFLCSYCSIETLQNGYTMLVQPPYCIGAL